MRTLACAVLILVLLGLAAAALASRPDTAGPLPVTVYYVNHTFVFTPGVKDASGIAYGTWTDDVLVTGWGTLELSTNAQYHDKDQMYAAGYLEGAATAQRIAESYANINYFFWNSTTHVPAEISTWFATNEAWMRDQVTLQASDPFWVMVGLLLAQMDGLTDGYNSVAPSNETMTLLQFQILSSTGDLLNLVNVVNKSARPAFERMLADEVERWFHTHTMCTGAIRATPDLGDILASHSAWFTYGAMNRIVKQYNLQLGAKFLASRSLAFSSYPGFLVSLDDYYIMGESQLTMVQTTNAIFNNDLLDLVNTSSLLSWVSVRLANHMANSGPEWFALDAKLNSGLYSNQYMVLDMKLFTPGMALAPNTLWVMDQIPGLTLGTDLTPLLANGYYGSYNVPWHYEIALKSGYVRMAKQTGSQTYTYDLAPRALLFRAYAQNITDIASLMFFARYNNYKHDPLEGGNPMNAIASRADLLTSGAGAFGAIDSKVSNSTLMKSLAFWAINGPTSVQQPVFSWTPEFSAMAVHQGCPQTYDFDFEYFAPPW